MPQSEVHTISLPVVVGSAFLALAVPSPYGWLTSVAGLSLLLMLLSFDEQAIRHGAQSLAYGAVCGLCLVLALYPAFGLLHIGAGFEPGLLAGWGREIISGPTSAGAVPSEVSRTPVPWGAIVWLIATLVFWGTDQSRMSGRAGAPLSGSLLATAPLANQPTASRPTASQPTMVRAQATMHSEPVAETDGDRPVAGPPPRVPATPVINPVPGASSQAVSSQAATALPANAVELPLGVGKPASIYINLLDTGIACLRPVGAEHLGKDFYRIVEQVPDGETWEFQTGQVVRCQKKNLSSGKALVAIEEAPRAS